MSVDRESLRRVAEAAMPTQITEGALRAFDEAVGPSEVLDLLDDNQRLRAAVRDLASLAESLLWTPQKIAYGDWNRVLRLRIEKARRVLGGSP